MKNTNRWIFTTNWYNDYIADYVGSFEDQYINFFDELTNEIGGNLYFVSKTKILVPYNPKNDEFNLTMHNEFTEDIIFSNEEYGSHEFFIIGEFNIKNTDPNSYKKIWDTIEDFIYNIDSSLYVYGPMPPHTSNLVLISQLYENGEQDTGFFSAPEDLDSYIHNIKEVFPSVVYDAYSKE